MFVPMAAPRKQKMMQKYSGSSSHAHTLNLAAYVVWNSHASYCDDQIPCTSYLHPMYKKFIGFSYRSLKATRYLWSADLS